MLPSARCARRVALCMSLATSSMTACGPSAPAKTFDASLPDDGVADGSVADATPLDATPDVVVIDAATGPGFLVTALSGFPTESGGTATFSVTLATAPTASVGVPVQSSDTTEGTVSPGSLVFTTSNWDVPQVVTITGVDDAFVDGAVPWSVVLGAATSSDTAYQGLDPTDVPLHTVDDDTADVVVSSLSKSVCDVAGDAATFTVRLSSQPSADVVLPLSTTGSGLSVAPTSITFTSSDWSTDRTVTVTAGASVTVGSASIVLGTPTTADLWYGATNPPDVSFDVCDVDGSMLVVTAAGGGTVPSPIDVYEDGRGLSIAVRLAAAPTADVTVALTETDPNEVAFSPGTLTFTSANWSTSQVVALAGVQDGVNDGAVAFDVVLTPTSTDARFASATPKVFPAVSHSAWQNVALGKSVTVTNCSSANSCTAPTTPGDLVDGSAATLVTMDSSRSGRPTLTVDLAASYGATTVTVDCPVGVSGAPPLVAMWSDPALQVSANGTSWTTVTYTLGVPFSITGPFRYARLIAGDEWLVFNGSPAPPSGNHISCRDLTVMASPD